jgi:outer membrane protein assembly factor BamA
LNSGTFERKPRLDVAELARDQLRIRVHYWRAGYRQAHVQTRLDSSGGGVAVTFDIVEGEPTIVKSVEVVQLDSVLPENRIRTADVPRTGEPLDIIALDSAQIQLRTMLRERGYADAVVRDTALVSQAEDSASVRVEIDPGRIATIASVDVVGNENVSERTILRLLDLNPGQLFLSEDLIEAQRRLYRSELFRHAVMEVEATPDSAKPVRVEVREAPFRAVRLGVGVNTVDFLQAEARFTRYNWYGTARRIDVRAAIGNLLATQLYGRGMFSSATPFGVAEDVDDAFLRPTWQVSAELSQPWLFRRNSIASSVFAHRRSVPGVVIDQGIGASLTFTRRIENRVHSSLTYRYERTQLDAGGLYFCVNFGVCQQETIGALSGSQSLSPLWFSLTVDRSDDPLEPSRGWTARLDAEHASVATASDFRYNRVSAEATYYSPFGPGVFAARIKGGWVRGIASTAAAVGVPDASDMLLHPRKQFYSGGSQSVRGYGENQLGPRILTIGPDLLLSADTTSTGCTDATIANGTCDPNVAASDDFVPRPLGGNSLIEGSLEYRIPLGKLFTVAAFVDGATVGDSGLDVPPGVRQAITPGFGMRYRSPIGPVRIDLGIRPRLNEPLPVVTQIEDENGDLQLVRLTTPKQYDPVGSSGGFFHRLFSRLQLHLSIGEAF